jgi:hypothetical protein
LLSLQVNFGFPLGEGLAAAGLLAKLLIEKMFLLLGCRHRDWGSLSCDSNPLIRFARESS